MLGLMQRYPLLISSLIVHAARHRGGAEVVSNLGGPQYHRTTYAEVERRSRRLARALAKLGVGLGDRVATLSRGTISATSNSIIASSAWAPSAKR
jgi:fatty-acyl-CoA synthase